MIIDFHPSALILEVSINFLGVPSGIVVSKIGLPSCQTSATINSANFFIETSVEQSMFTKPCSLQFCKKKQASAKSSTCKNSLLGVPVPQMVTVSSLFFLLKLFF
jgi:hypothetical protein